METTSKPPKKRPSAGAGNWKKSTATIPTTSIPNPTSRHHLSRAPTTRMKVWHGLARAWSDQGGSLQAEEARAGANPTTATPHLRHLRNLWIIRNPPMRAHSGSKWITHGTTLALSDGHGSDFVVTAPLRLRSILRRFGGLFLGEAGLFGLPDQAEEPDAQGRVGREVRSGDEVGVELRPVRDSEGAGSEDREEGAEQAEPDDREDAQGPPCQQRADDGREQRGDPAGRTELAKLVGEFVADSDELIGPAGVEISKLLGLAGQFDLALFYDATGFIGRRQVALQVAATELEDDGDKEQDDDRPGGEPPLEGDRRRRRGP